MTHNKLSRSSCGSAALVTKSALCCLITASLLFGCASNRAAERSSEPLQNQAVPSQDTTVSQQPAREPTDAERVRDRDNEAVATALVILERLAGDAHGANGNCRAIAGAIADSVSANSSLWVRLSQISADQQREIVLHAAEEPLKEVMGRFATALGECAFDPDVRLSLEAMVFTSPST